MLNLADGERRTGGDLRAAVERARSFAHVLEMMHQRYDRKVVEQEAIARLLDPKLADDEKEAERLATVVAHRLAALSEETERGLELEAAVPDGGFRIRARSARREGSASGRLALLQSAGSRNLHSHHMEFAAIFEGYRPRLERESQSRRRFSGRAA